jgi:predicted AlkP superfamily phosphohydrolase/phosphomutase
MELEDEILDELESLERTIFDKDKVIEDKDKVIEDKDNIIEEQNKILSEALEALVDSGMTLDAAKTILNLQSPDLL